MTSVSSLPVKQVREHAHCLLGNQNISTEKTQSDSNKQIKMTEAVEEKKESSEAKLRVHTYPLIRVICCIYLPSSDFNFGFRQVTEVGGVRLRYFQTCNL